MTYQVESSRYSLALRSVCSWDLWTAIVVSIFVGIIWIRIHPEPKQIWITPILIMSGILLALVWNHWRNFQTQLQVSDYGELVRLADKSEYEIRLPYVITLWIASGSLFVSTITAIIIEDINSNQIENMLIISTSLLATWLVFAWISLLRLSIEHDQNMAEIKSRKEEVEAAQRNSSKRNPT